MTAQDQNILESGEFSWDGWIQGVSPALRAGTYYAYMVLFLDQPDQLSVEEQRLLWSGIHKDSEATDQWAQMFAGEVDPLGNDVGQALDKETFEQWLAQNGTDEQKGDWYWARKDALESGDFKPAWASAVDWGLAILGPGKALKAAGATGRIATALGAQGPRASALGQVGSVLLRVAGKLPTSTKVAGTAITGVSLTSFAASLVQAELDPETVLELENVALEAERYSGTGTGTGGEFVSGGGPRRNQTIWTGGTLEEAEAASGLDAAIMAEALQDQDPLIGFENFTQQMVDEEGGVDVYQPPEGPWLPNQFYAPRGRTVEVAPQYRHSQTVTVLGDMTPGQILDFQRQAVQAGLLDEGSFQLGARDAQSVVAMKTVMGNANLDGRTWQETLGQMVEAAKNAPSPSDMRGAFQRRAYEQPDMVSLEQAAKQGVRQQLGRDINQWEMSMLVEQMRANHRQQFENEESLRLSEWEAQGRAMDDPNSVSTAPKPVQGFDASARNQALFESMFANELDRNERTADVQRKTGSLMAGLNRAANLVGGG